MKKLVSMLVVGSQLAMYSVGALAQNPTVSPEQELVEAVIALQGKKVSSETRQAVLSAAIATYVRQAPAAGQNERLEKALVNMAVFTPAQAKAYVADAAKGAEKIEANANSADEVRQELPSSIEKLGQLHPAGAQFSETSCTAAAIVGGVGLLTAVVGLAIGSPSCYTPHEDVVTSGWIGNDYVDVTTSVPTGPTRCSNPSRSDRQTGNQLLVYGAVGLGVAGLIALAGGCFN